MANDIKQAPKTHSNSPVPGPPRTFIDECNEYLEASGWKKLGTDESGITSWEEPMGTGSRAGVRKLQGYLPARNGAEPTPLYQIVNPPTQWTYGMNEAVAIQRQRDLAKERAETKKAS